MHQLLKGFLAVAVAGALAGCASAPSPKAPPVKAPPPVPSAASTEDEQTLYALGALLSQNIDSFGLSEQEFDTVRRGFTDGYHHLPSTQDAQTHVPQVQALARDRARKNGEAFLAKAEATPGAIKTASGLIYLSVQEGTGTTPQRTDRVKVNYEGRLVDGTVFDSSAQHGGAPASFAVTGVIACWTEALQMMKVGGKAHIVCPASIAYGERPAGKIRPGSVLAFDIELLDILQ